MAELLREGVSVGVSDPVTEALAPGDKEGAWERVPEAEEKTVADPEPDGDRDCERETVAQAEEQAD